MATRTVLIALGIHAVFGFFPFLHLAALNPVSEFVKRFVMTSFEKNYGRRTTGEESVLWSMTASAYFIGCLVGSIIFGPLADNIGRKLTIMLVMNVVSIVGSGLEYGSVELNRFEMLIFGRFILGIAGSFCLLCTVYIQECASDEDTGFVGSVTLASACFMDAFGTIINLPFLLGTEALWKYSTIVPVVGQFGHMAFIFYLHESPKHLYITVGSIEKAKAAFHFYRGENADWEAQRAHYERERQLAEHHRIATIREILTTRHLLWPFWLCVFTAAVCNWGGIDITTLYSAEIMQKLGISQKNSSVFTSFFQLLPAAFLGAFVSGFRLMDRFGRRPVLFTGLAVGMLGTVLLLISGFVEKDTFGPILGGAGILSIQYGYNMGPSMIGLLSAELAPQTSRAKTAGAFWVSHWVCSIAISLGYPPLKTAVGTLSTLPLTLASLVAVIFLFYKLPETNGKSVEEVVEQWKKVERNEHTPLYPTGSGNSLDHIPTNIA